MSKPNKKEYQPSFGFWITKKGNGYTSFVNDDLLALLGELKAGDRLYLAEVPEKYKNEKSPSFRVTVFKGDENGDSL